MTQNEKRLREVLEEAQDYLNGVVSSDNCNRNDFEFLDRIKEALSAPQPAAPSGKLSEALRAAIYAMKMADRHANFGGIEGAIRKCEEALAAMDRRPKAGEGVDIRAGAKAIFGVFAGPDDVWDELPDLPLDGFNGTTCQKDFLDCAAACAAVWVLKEKEGV